MSSPAMSMIRGHNLRRAPIAWRGAVLLLVGSLSQLATAGGLSAAGQDGRQLESRAASALRQGVAAWQRFLEDQKALGPDALGKLVVVLQARQEVLAERVERSPRKKQYDRMLVKRQRLDAARRHALKLIFDEQRYFYPYEQPDVSAEVAALYPPVQREVNERVAKVRELWEDGSAAVIPDTLRQQAEQIRWVSEALDGLDRARPEMQARMQWLLTLPASGRLTLQGFCESTEELEQLKLAERIEAVNQRVGAELSSGEKTLVAITNEYRRMLGRVPMALDAKLVRAAQGHGEEMSTLGYVSHLSPAPGRHTPGERMEAAGYRHPSGENLFWGRESPLEVLGYWMHSSAHHRGLLGHERTEFGVGNTGSYWVVNFGRGQEFRNAPEFKAGGDR